MIKIECRLLGEPKWGKLIWDSSRTSVRSFTPLSFSAAEKSVTVQTQAQKLTKYPVG